MCMAEISKWILPQEYDLPQASFLSLLGDSLWFLRASCPACWLRAVLGQIRYILLELLYKLL